MKTEKYKITLFSKWAAMVAFLSLALLTACDDDEPKREDTPEMITRVTLTFTPSTGGSPVVVAASDPDGEGVRDIEISGSINLAAGTSYLLSIELANELAPANDPAYDITEEVREEGDEHMLFFAWTDNVFSDPAGNGNIDNRSDAVNYEDEDENGLPLGLETSWTTGNASSGKFRILLKHQPELKSETSTASMGETDIDIEFDINVQ